MMSIFDNDLHLIIKDSFADIPVQQVSSQASPQATEFSTLVSRTLPLAQVCPPQDSIDRIYIIRVESYIRTKTYVHSIQNLKNNLAIITTKTARHWHPIPLILIPTYS